MEAKEKILALVNPEYMNRIPSFIRGHATGRTVEKIEKEHPELFAAFTTTDTPDSAVIEEMSQLINGIFKERMEKHHMFSKED